MKTCGHCKQVKPFDEFYRNKARKDGLEGHCKECSYAKSVAKKEKYHQSKGTKSAYPRRLAAENLKNGVRHCPMCQVVQPLDKFPANKAHKNNVGAYCLECLAKRNRDIYSLRNKDSRAKYYQQNKTKILRDRTLKRYNLTNEEYDSMLNNQNHSCAICHTHKDIQPLCVDHDHNTGKVRELLCSDCNSALGRIKEDEIRALAMIAYIQKHRT